MKRFFLISAALLAASSALARDDVQAPPARGNDPLNAVVKLEIVFSRPDYVYPWKRSGNSSGDSTGVVIAPGRILTCAHCVADSTYIRVRKNNEDSLYHGVAEFVGNDSDLALIRVDDPAFMADITPMELGETPDIQADVLAVGYPIGGKNISFTRGIVSRIEDRLYTHSYQTLLAAQVDAVINPGNSGGPVLDLETGRIGGIAFQGDKRGEALGYMIPIEVVRQFLDDIKDGRIDGVGESQFSYAVLENAGTRRHLGMKPDQTGVLLTHVDENSTNQLAAGDVLLAVDGRPVANNGNIRLDKNEIRSIRHPFYLRQIGDEVPVRLLRDGKEIGISVPVKKLDLWIRPLQHDATPDYYLCGGFVFTTATPNYLLASRPKLHDDLAREKRSPDEEAVLIGCVLPDLSVEGYIGVEGGLVRTLDGKKVRNLRGLVAQIEASTNEFLRIHLDRGDEWDFPVIVDRAELLLGTSRVMQRYGIPADRSADLQAAPEK